MGAIRIGTIGYSCQSGLGILAKAFWDHGIVNQMFILEHSRHPTEWQWYPQTTPHCPIRDMDGRAMRRFVSELDVFLAFETPFEWALVNYAKQLGVKTVLMPMYECSLEKPPAHFDEYWCPSLLDMQVFCGWPNVPLGLQNEPFIPCTSNLYQGSICRFTPVPVDVEWRQRTEAKVFVHNAGHGGLKGRNGTKELLEAMDYVKSPIKLILRSQEPILGDVGGDARVDFRVGTFPQENLYSEGDIFIFPEKFNGLSLPLQEARAAGMLVMATDRHPINTWLPTEPLIPVTTTVRNRIGPPYMEFDEAVIDPRDIAAKIDEWYGRDISSYSQSGGEWADSMSWDRLGSEYLTLLRGLQP